MLSQLFDTDLDVICVLCARISVVEFIVCEPNQNMEAFRLERNPDSFYGEVHIVAYAAGEQSVRRVVRAPSVVLQTHGELPPVTRSGGKAAGKAVGKGVTIVGAIHS